TILRMTDELRATQARAEARRRALAALEAAGFAECAVPGLDARSEAPAALVVHDGRSRALESELVALAHDAIAAAHAGAALALTLRSLEPARALLAAHGVDAEASALLLADPRALPAAFAPLEALGAEAATESPEHLEKVLLALLGRLRFKTYGTRSPAEVAARL